MRSPPGTKNAPIHPEMALFRSPHGPMRLAGKIALLNQVNTVFDFGPFGGAGGRLPLKP